MKHRENFENLTPIFPERRFNLETSPHILSTRLLNLIAPIAMEEGLRFAIREGGRTVGAGVVAKIIE